MNIYDEARLRFAHLQTRRHFLKSFSAGLGGAALSSLLGPAAMGMPSQMRSLIDPLSPKPPHFVPKATRVIFLHMAGAPSQLELFDYKPILARLDGELTPPSLLEGKRFSFIKGIPKMLGPQATFKQHGKSGAWISKSPALQ